METEFTRRTPAGSCGVRSARRCAGRWRGPVEGAAPGSCWRPARSPSPSIPARRAPACRCRRSCAPAAVERIDAEPLWQRATTAGPSGRQAVGRHTPTPSGVTGRPRPPATGFTYTRGRPVAPAPVKPGNAVGGEGRHWNSTMPGSTDRARSPGPIGKRSMRSGARRGSTPRSGRGRTTPSPGRSPAGRARRRPSRAGRIRGSGPPPSPLS